MAAAITLKPSRRRAKKANTFNRLPAIVTTWSISEQD